MFLGISPTIKQLFKLDSSEFAKGVRCKLGIRFKGSVCSRLLVAIMNVWRGVGLHVLQSAAAALMSLD